MSENKHPEVLVTTDWAVQNLNTPGIRLVEVDVDTTAYDKGHIPGAVGWNWQTQLQDNIRRDLIEKPALEKLLGDSGISNDTTILLYGDNQNWFAAYAFWQLKYYGHKDVRLINGGRKKWIAQGLPTTTDPAHVKTASYRASKSRTSLCALEKKMSPRSWKTQARTTGGCALRGRLHGKILAPPGLSETAQRAGHIPGAENIPWAQAANEDGTFKSYEELKQLYDSNGITGNDGVIAYCRIGERSSHTWFALKYLLGYNDVRNYDGSWTERGRSGRGSHRQS